MKKKFSEVAEIWKAEKAEYVKESTIAAYGTIIRKHLLPRFGDMENITEDDVQAFVLQKHSSGLSNKSVKDIIMVLNMIIRFGDRKKIFPSHILEVHYPLEVRRCAVRTFSRTDQSKIMRYIENHPDCLNLGIYICLSTGLRIGELCGLKWEDVDLNSGVINIRRTLQRIYVPENTGCHTKLIINAPKTKNSVRSVPIGGKLLELMRKVQKDSKAAEYVLSGSSKPVEPRSYRNHYNRLITLLGIQQLNFHALRHTFATRCVESRCDYKTISSLLGHTNISTTLNLYVHPDMNQKRDCIEQMFSSIFPTI